MVVNTFMLSWQAYLMSVDPTKYGSAYERSLSCSYPILDAIRLYICAFSIKSSPDGGTATDPGERHGATMMRASVKISSQTFILQACLSFPDVDIVFNYNDVPFGDLGAKPI
jgi:hypothetical protein